MTAKKQQNIQPAGNVIDYDAVMARLGESTPQAAPTQPTGFMRGMADIGLSLGQGVVGSVKSLTDLAGAGNPVSDGLESMSKFMGEQKSAQSQATLKASQERVKAAEESGSTWEEAKAYMGMLFDQPGEMLAQGIGSFATMGFGKAASALKLAQSAKAAGMTKEAFLATKAGQEAAAEAAKVGMRTGIGVGAAQGVGAVKGSQYEQTYNNAIARGVPEDQARALADEAQSYGGSASGTMQQVLGGVLGAGAAATGPIERLIVGKKAAESAGGLMARVAKGGATEFATEGLQGAQERYAGNRAAVDSGVLPEDQVFRGVVGQGLQEGTIGGVLGGVGGGLESSAPPQVVPESGPLSRAANAGAAVTPPAPPPLNLSESDTKGLLDFANLRFRALEEKASGTKDQTITGPDGKKVTVPGKPAEFLTPDEKAERDFLAQNGGDAQALAKAYGYTPANMTAQGEADLMAKLEAQAKADQRNVRDFSKPKPAPSQPVAGTADPTPEAATYAPTQPKPFKSKKAAEKYRNAQGDPTAFEVAQEGDAFVVRPIVGFGEITGDDDGSANSDAPAGAADGGSVSGNQGLVVGAGVGADEAGSVGADAGTSVDGAGQRDSADDVRPGGDGATAKLSKELAGAKPNYAIGDRKFSLSFESDTDKALFITSQATPSKRDADYRQFLKDNGYTDEQIAQEGKAIRDRIKEQAKGSDPGELRIGKAAPEAPKPAEAVKQPAQPQAQPLAPANPQQRWDSMTQAQRMDVLMQAGWKSPNSESAKAASNQPWEKLGKKRDKITAAFVAMDSQQQGSAPKADSGTQAGQAQQGKPEEAQAPADSATEQRITRRKYLPDNMEVRVYEYNGGFAAGLYDTDAGKYVDQGIRTFPSANFPGDTAEQKANEYADTLGKKSIPKGETTPKGPNEQTATTPLLNPSDSPAVNDYLEGRRNQGGKSGIKAKPANTSMTKADAQAAERQTAEAIGQRIDAMQAQEVRKIASRFLPTMGIKAPVGKEKIKQAVTDFAKVNPLAAASEFGVELAPSVRQALEAQMEGRLSNDDGAANASQEVRRQDAAQANDRLESQWQRLMSDNPDAVASELTAEDAKTHLKRLDAAPGDNARARAVLEQVANTEGGKVTAIHQDPGEKPEQATKAVVNESLKTAAKNEGAKPSEMRKWLLSEIDKALLTATDRPDFDEAVKQLGEKDAVSAYSGNGPLGRGIVDDFVTFNVPGDGKFKIRNSVRSLMEFRKKAAASPGFKDNGQKTLAPEENSSVLNAPGGKMGAVLSMIEEGDFEAARDFAEAQGINLDDVKVPRGDMKPAWEQFRKDGTLPPEPKQPSKEWQVTQEQNWRSGLEKVARLTRVADGSTYVATVSGPVDGSGAVYKITKDGEKFSEMTSRRPFSEAMLLAESAIPQANDKPAPSKESDTGWNMAGTGYGGKRYIGRNITLPDGREVVARVYENAGAYEEAEVKVDGVRKFTVTDRYNAQDKADAFIKTLTATGEKITDKLAAPEKMTPRQFDEWIRSQATVQTEQFKGDRNHGGGDEGVGYIHLSGEIEKGGTNWAGTATGPRDKRDTRLIFRTDDNKIVWYDDDTQQVYEVAKDDPRLEITRAEPRPKQVRDPQEVTVTADGADYTVMFDEPLATIADQAFEDNLYENGIPGVAKAEFRKARTQAQAGNDASLKPGGNRRDPTKVSLMNPYEVGDVVTIDGKDWTVQKDMPGWYLTTTGNWRGQHPTIKGIPAMTDLIREVEQAATAQTEAQAGSVSKPDIANIRRDATLDKQTSENGEVMTRREWVQRKVAEGLKPAIKQEDRIKPMSRMQFFRASNEEQRAHERRVKAAGKKDVYWIGNYEVTKTEHDYAVSLLADPATKDATAQPEAKVDTPKLTAEQRKTLDESLLAGAISVEDYMKATGLADEDVGTFGDSLRTQADQKAQDESPYFQAINKIRETLAEQMKVAMDSPSSTPQQRKSKQERMARIDRDRDTLDMLARKFEHPFDHKYVSKLSPILSNRHNKRFDGIAVGDKAKIEYRDAAYRNWAELLIEAANKKAGNGDGPAKGASKQAETITDVGEKIGGARKDTATSALKGSKRKSEDSRPAWARRFEISQIVTPSGMAGEVKDAGRWVIHDTKSLDWMKRPKQVGRSTFATKEEAEAFVPLAAVGLKHKPVPTSNGKYEIWREISDRKRVKVVDREFDTRDEALSYMLANPVAIIETNTTFGEADMPLPPDRARTGPERRTGNVTGQDFKDTFGFRGVEFGEWNNQDERQSLMNNAWDGLMDLAEVMNVEPKALGLNGDLALAFGARGYGLNSARAHYELDRAVINLTKEKGAGSLAHEWFHALDHYFGRQDGKASAEWVQQPDGTRTLKVSDGGADMASAGFRINRSGVRPELRAAYETLLKTIFKKAETYVEDTAKADKFVGAVRDELAEALDRLRADLSEQKDPKYWKRNNKPASAEQLAEFDTIAKAMLDGDVAALTTDWRTLPTTDKARAVNRWTNDTLERLSAIYKEVRGRSGFDSASQSGVLDRLRGNMNRYSQRLKMLADAQAGTEKQRSVPTEFAMNARELDQGRGSDYWTTPHEMAARAFQGYVEDKIAERGGTSRFLNYAPENAAILTPWGFKRPFPAGQERRAINAAFDALIGEIKTRTDEAGNVAMFSRNFGYSNRAAGIPVRDAQAAADLIRRQMPSAPEIVILERVDDAPAALLAKIDSASARYTVEGAYFDGKIYAFPANFDSLERFQFVVGRHEVRHAGFDAMLGDQRDAMLLSIAQANRGLMLQAQARRGNDGSLAESIEEVLADTPVEDLAKLTRIKVLVAAVRRWLRDTAFKLRKAGFKALADAIEPRTWSDNDVLAFVLKAEDISRGPGGPGGGGKDASLSRKKRDQTQSPEFKRWFGNSKVVDANGKPLVVYHGTKKKFTVFTPGWAPGWGTGIYLTDNREQARDEFGDGEDSNVLDLYVSMQNPWREEMGYGVLRIKESDAWDKYAQSKGVRPPSDPDYDPDIDDLSVEDAIEESGELVNRVIRERGYDGIIANSSNSINGLEIVAFYPEQIKSATGNNGDFDPANPDIRFSRRPTEAVRDAALRSADAMKEVSLMAGYKMGDFMQSSGTLSWWDKTVGTPYNLAKKNPRTFGKVYDAVQGFLSDISAYANRAADLAPNILPRLEKLSDIGKQPISAEDNKAIAAPIFEGTLNWTRRGGKLMTMEQAEAQAAAMDVQDKAQELVRMRLLDPKVLRMWQGLPLDRYESAVNTRYQNEMLRPGVVWSDAELRDKFNLTDGQIKLYREFRQAVDQSLDDMAISEMRKLVGDEVQADIEGMSAYDASEAYRQAIADAIEATPERKASLDKLADKLVLLGNRIKDLKDRGYAPLSRFGHHTLDVMHNGERVYFGMFESKAEANKMARQMAQQFPGADITQGTQSQEDYKRFAGVTPETLEIFGSILGLDVDGDSASDQAFQEYLRKATATRSALRRLIHRKGTAGFSEDVGRVLSSFITSNARRTASNLNARDIALSLDAVPREQGQMRDYAIKMAEYVQNPQEEAQAIRSVMFAQYLGGSIASAMVNMTQPVTVTMPYLSQFGGAKKAASAITTAFKDAAKENYEADLKEALEREDVQAVVDPQEIHQLQAQSRGVGSLRSGDGTKTGDALAKAQNALAKVSLAWGKLFGMAELINRRVTFIAAYRMAKANGNADPVKFAIDAINETQFTYNKGNRPQWARGAIGATLFTFKTYSVSYVELMARNWKLGGPDGKKAVMLAMAVMFLMGGADEFPFMEDAEDVIDGFMQRVMGRNWSTKQKRNEWLAGTFGQGMADFIAKGISGLPGVPIDVSGRFGMGNLIPGTGLLRKDSRGLKDATEVLGPIADLATRGATAAGYALQGEAYKAAREASPVAARNILKSADMAMTGMYRDDKGRKVVDADLGDAAAKFIGFQPNAVAKVQDATATQQRIIALNKVTEAEIADLWAQGRFENDPEKVERARERLREWNQDNPETPIRISQGQIIKRVREMRLDKTQRLEKTAPKEIRASVREALAER